MRFIALALLLLGSCVFSAHQRALRMEGRYVTGSPPNSGWLKVSPGGADQAWWNPEVDATIYTDNNCGIRYQDSSLVVLTDHLLQGISYREKTEEQVLDLDGTEALLTVTRGTLDGFPVQIASVVLQKDSCVYDLLFLSASDRFSDGLLDFKVVYQGFHTRSRH